MKHCSQCRRFTAGRPTYCPFCGRSYNVKICPRGHASPRGVTFCAECGSGDLSTPAPPPTIGSQWLLLVVELGGRLVPLLAIVAGLLVVLLLVDLGQLFDALFPLLLLLGLASWLFSLLPAPVKRLGRSAWRQAGQAVKHRKGR
jgi:hypothetical protein